MRVLITIHQFFPAHHAGTEVAARDAALELQRRGHEVHVLTVDPRSGHSGPGIGARDYEYRGLRVHALRIPDRLATRLEGAAPVRLEYADDGIGEHVGAWARRLGPDVVHMFHLARLTGSTLDALRELEVPLVFTATDFWPVCVRSILMTPGGDLCGGPDRLSANCLECRRADRWYGVEQPSRPQRRRRAYRRLARQALAANGDGGPREETVRAVIERREFLRERLSRVDAVLAPTALMAEMLVANGLPSELVRVQPYSLDLRRLSAARPYPRARATATRFAYIGTVSRPKGVHVLIRAFRRLPHPDATLEIIGDVGAEPEYFRKLHSLAADDARIRFAGRVPNERIAERLRRVDVQVVPSIWYENAPLTIYSAQAAGVPVVASNLGGMSELIADGVNGLLFAPGDAGDLATRLDRLASEPGLVERLAAAAREPVGVVDGVDELLTLYGSLAARRGPGHGGPPRAPAHEARPRAREEAPC